MTKPKIAIDIDDVLADNAAGFVAYSNYRWGTSLTVSDYIEDWASVWKLEHDIEEVIRRRDEFVTSTTHSELKPIDGAKDVLIRLSRNFELSIVTSRMKLMKDGTRQWLDKHYEGIFSYDMVHHAGIWDELTAESVKATKSGVVDSINADYLIDDQLKHCEAVAETGKKAILFGDYAWNQTEQLPERIVRLRDWKSVEAYFGKELGS